MPISEDEYEKLSPSEKAAYLQMHQPPPESVSPWGISITKHAPQNAKQFFAGILGLPIERQYRQISHPLLITTFIALLVAGFLYTNSLGLETSVDNWGFIPAKFYRHYFLTLLTSFFLHGSWMHLLSNTYYFYIFGDDVEDDMDLPSFLKLLFGGHVFGMILHALLTGDRSVPCVGASAGISALLGYYMIRFPRRHITFMFFFFYFWIHVPALYAFMWKFAWDLMLSSVESVTHVAHWAHIGGAIFGAVLALNKKRHEQI